MKGIYEIFVVMTLIFSVATFVLVAEGTRTINNMLTIPKEVEYIDKYIIVSSKETSINGCRYTFDLYGFNHINRPISHSRRIVAQDDCDAFNVNDKIRMVK